MNNFTSNNEELLTNPLSKQEKQNKKRSNNIFKPGNNFGKGRPAGSKSNAQLALEEIGYANAELVLHKAISLALTGDSVAIKCILDRVYPVRKGRLIKTDLPKVETIDDVCNAISCIIDSMSRGIISYEEAYGIISIIELKRKSIETNDIDKRFHELELQLKHKER